MRVEKKNSIFVNYKTVKSYQSYPRLVSQGDLSLNVWCKVETLFHFGGRFLWGKAAFCFINAHFCLLNEAYLSVYLSGFEAFHICPNTWQDLKKIVNLV